MISGFYPSSPDMCIPTLTHKATERQETERERERQRRERQRRKKRGVGGKRMNLK